MTPFSRAIEAAYRAHSLTRLHVHVLYAVQRLRSENPSHARLAAVCACSVSSVRRALDRAHSLGLLSWVRRIVVIRGLARRQIANAYSLSGGPIGYKSLASSSSFGLNTCPELEAIRLRREAVIAAQWAAKRASQGIRSFGNPASGIPEGIPWPIRATSGR